MINERQAHKYCKEEISKIENYEKAIADTTRTWVCHHRTEIWWNSTKKELIENECYFNRKACELMFLTQAEHARLHMTDEHRKKISVSNTGKHSVLTISSETREKMRESHKGKIFTTAHKLNLSEAVKAYWAKRKQGGNYDAKMG